MHQLNAKRTWEVAAEAVRHLSSYDLAPIQHPAAYINHIIKHFTPGVAGGAGGVGSGGSGVASGQIRLASVPISTKVRRWKGRGRTGSQQWQSMRKGHGGRPPGLDCCYNMRLSVAEPA